jgi:hypothetical protein
MANQFIGQSPDMYDLQRKQALADMLMQQSLAPSQTQVIGRTAIPQSPFEGLSKLAQAYASQRLQKQAAEQRQGIQQQGIQDASKFAAALRGTPAVEAHELPANQQGPTNEAIAAKGPDLAQAMQIAMGSNNPLLQQAGGALLTAQMPKAPKWTPVEQYNRQTGMKEKVLIDENNPQNRLSLGGQEAVKKEVGPAGQVYDPYAVKSGDVIADPNKPFYMGPDGKMIPNQAYQTYELGKAKAGAPSTTVQVQNQMGKSAAEQVGPLLKEGRDSALGAQQGVSTADRVIKAVSGNALTGPGATFRLKGLQIGQALGVTGANAQEQLLNTRAAIQGLAQSSLAARASLKGQGQISDFEGKLLERAASGSIDDMTAGEIKQLAEVNKRLSQRQIDIHQQNVEKMRKDKTLAPLADLYELPKVNKIRRFNPATGGFDEVNE